ncbi:uncharacterized protein V6R79_026162 [Siganus canaliculatus]
MVFVDDCPCPQTEEGAIGPQKLRRCEVLAVHIPHYLLLRVIPLTFYYSVTHLPFAFLLLVLKIELLQFIVVVHESKKSFKSQNSFSIAVLVCQLQTPNFANLNIHAYLGIVLSVLYLLWTIISSAGYSLSISKTASYTENDHYSVYKRVIFLLNSESVCRLVFHLLRKEFENDCHRGQNPVPCCKDDDIICKVTVMIRSTGHIFKDAEECKHWIQCWVDTLMKEAVMIDAVWPITGEQTCNNS